MERIFGIHSHLEVWDAELVIGGEVVGACGCCHQLVPCLLAGLLTRSRDQPKLGHGYSSREASGNWKGSCFSLIVCRFHNNLNICVSKEEHLPNELTRFCFSYNTAMNGPSTDIALG